MSKDDALWLALAAVTLLSVVIIGGYLWLISHIGFIGTGL